MTMRCPFQGQFVICRLELNLSTKFEVSMFAYYVDMKHTHTQPFYCSSEICPGLPG